MSGAWCFLDYFFCGGFVNALRRFVQQAAPVPEALHYSIFLHCRMKLRGTFPARDQTVAALFRLRITCDINFVQADTDCLLGAIVFC